MATFKKEWFNPLYFVLKNCFKAYPNINKAFIYGGKSSAKTYTVSQFIAVQTFQKELDAIAFRKESVTIQTTLKKSFTSAIESTRLKNAFNEQLMAFRCENGADI
jgi:phage terminase large subunit